MNVIRYLLFVSVGIIFVGMYGSWLAERDSKLFDSMKHRKEMICKQFTHHPDCP